MKTGLHDRLRATQRDRLAPDTGPMTGSISNQQPSTIRGEAQCVTASVSEIGQGPQSPSRRRGIGHQLRRPPVDRSEMREEPDAENVQLG